MGIRVYVLSFMLAALILVSNPSLILAADDSSTAPASAEPTMTESAGLNAPSDTAPSVIPQEQTTIQQTKEEKITTIKHKHVKSAKTGVKKHPRKRQYIK